MRQPVTAIFDIGKTNKKFFLFNQDLQEINHEYYKLPLVEDDDGFPCDDLTNLTKWILDTIKRIESSSAYELRGLNFSTYGATLVHLNEKGKPATHLYNYLKPFPEHIQEEFIAHYGKDINDLETASPNLGMLNSALQLYWLKKDKPELFKNIRHTLHFPQYLSYLFTGKLASEPTSIGCHTKLWDFKRNTYHHWLAEEGFTSLFPAIVPTTHSFNVTFNRHPIKIGVGIHDSSSALASYMLRSDESFLLVSTGTWSITLNAFTDEPLTVEELQRDCLSYLSIHGNPVKSSRLFLGNELDYQVEKLNEIFHKEAKYYKQIKLDETIFKRIQANDITNTFYPATLNNPTLTADVFKSNVWNPSSFKTYEEAYHQLIWGLVNLQVASIKLAQGKSAIRKIYVDGGFVDNDIFIKLLQYYLPEYKIEASHLPLGSAYGAAMILQGSKVRNVETV